jgi:TPP-dependent pyruvate/acetoin dehydrogenase alpha subunit
MPMAVGLGLAANMQKKDFITMCVFGDGGVGEGEFHEALNLSKLWNAPVVWFCENNGYGMGVPLRDSLANEIYRLAAAYNMPSVQVDGMDVLAVHEAARKAVEYARSGSGPYFIEAMTYRYRGHSMADPELYRTKAEIEESKRRDPIDRLKRHMIDDGMLDEVRFEAIEARAGGVVDEAIAFADASPQPPISSLFNHITEEGDRG